MLVARQAHLQQRRTHLGADGDRAVDRRDGEMATLGARPVAKVSALIGAAGVGRQLDIVQLEARLVIAGFETDIVEHEEFDFGAAIDGVTDPRRPDIRLGSFGCGARVEYWKSVEEGKGVSVCFDIGGPSRLNTKKANK